MIPLSIFFYFKLLKLFSAVFLVAKVSNKGNKKKKRPWQPWWQHWVIFSDIFSCLTQFYISIFLFLIFFSLVLFFLIFIAFHLFFPFSYIYVLRVSHRSNCFPVDCIKRPLKREPTPVIHVMVKASHWNATIVLSVNSLKYKISSLQDIGDFFFASFNHWSTTFFLNLWL